MRWPIRYQILVPIAAVLLVAISAIAVTTSYLAVRASEQRTIRQLRQVLTTLEDSTFPVTEVVLEKMRGLSGAEYIAVDSIGQVVASTLAEPPGEIAQELAQSLTGRDLDSLIDQPAIELGGTNYMAAALTMTGASGVTGLIVLYPERAWRQARWEAAAPPMLVGAVAFVIMLAVVGWIAQRISRRIGQVRQRVLQIAAGQFTPADAGPLNDEIAELVGGVNRMVEQLTLLHETIRRTERSRLLGQLAGGLAHQLRNAITGARMAIGLHAKRCTEHHDDQSLQVALRQLMLTEEHIKSLLSVGKGERRAPTSFDIRRIVSDVAALIEAPCKHSQVQLETTQASDSLVATVEVESVRSAVLNLALNAIEAAGAGGRVSLTADRCNGEIVIAVTDTGLGPPADIAASIFEPFVTSKPEGVGLGLALVAQCAIDHRGRLEWERAGNCTRFVMRWPA